ncbi:MAG TPA: 3'-5' exonuclease, partial [Defluviitaleaceae bacterium]|nr:3'-5' exonuclease [Defluviitaleaceae bacterium]
MVNSYLENYVVFDLETTGCNPVKDYIIEIGALKIVNGKIHSSFNELINPGIAIPN